MSFTNQQPFTVTAAARFEAIRHGLRRIANATPERRTGSGASFCSDIAVHFPLWAGETAE